MGLRFRGEFFSLFNHPNFGPPEDNLTDVARDSRFGDQLTLKQYLEASHIVVSTLAGVQTIPDKQVTAAGGRRISSSRYNLRYEGRDYDSKAIDGVAFGIQHKTAPLGAEEREIHGGIKPREAPIMLSSATLALGLPALFESALPAWRAAFLTVPSKVPVPSGHKSMATNLWP